MYDLHYTYLNNSIKILDFDRRIESVGLIQYFFFS